MFFGIYLNEIFRVEYEEFRRTISISNESIVVQINWTLQLNLWAINDIVSYAIYIIRIASAL